MKKIKNALVSMLILAICLTMAVPALAAGREYYGYTQGTTYLILTEYCVGSLHESNCLYAGVDQRGRLLSLEVTTYDNDTAFSYVFGYNSTGALTEVTRYDGSGDLVLTHELSYSGGRFDRDTVTWANGKTETGITGAAQLSNTYEALDRSRKTMESWGYAAYRGGDQYMLTIFDDHYDEFTRRKSRDAIITIGFTPSGDVDVAFVNHYYDTKDGLGYYLFGSWPAEIGGVHVLVTREYLVGPLEYVQDLGDFWTCFHADAYELDDRGNITNYYSAYSMGLDPYDWY